MYGKPDERAAYTPNTAVADTIETLSSFVNDRFGPFFNFQQIRLALDVEIWLSVCQISRVPAGSVFSHLPYSGAGVSPDKCTAMLRNLAEAAERYSGVYSQYYDMPRQCELGESRHYGSYPRCATDEGCTKIFATFAPSDICQHSSVRNLRTGSTEWIPSAFVHLGQTLGPNDICHPISTGLAFHTDVVSAIRSGIYEVLERDALMLFWHSKSNAAKISADSMGDEQITRLIKSLARAGQRVSFIDISPDGSLVPVLMCVVAGEKYPFYSVGAACTAEPKTAAIKALEEALSVQAYLRSRLGKSIDSLGDWNRINHLEAHAILYAHWPNAPAFRFLDEIDEISCCDRFRKYAHSSPRSSEDLERFASELSERGLNVLWRDVTAPEFEQVGRAVKVVIPEAVPLSQAFNARWLRTPRLMSYLEGAHCAPCEYPHPFA